MQHPAQRFAIAGKQAVIATMHGKERVIAPLLQGALQLQVEVAKGLDTDRFGTFSREIERAGSQVDAARAKIAAAFERHPDAPVAIASEGSFGPHPSIPFVALGREIVVLFDRETGLQVIGRHADMATNFQHVQVADVAAALDFAERVDFPAHGVIVMACADGVPAPTCFVRKAIETTDDLARTVTAALSLGGAAQVETDMRAHRNPTRLRAIKRATLDLVRRCRSPCPLCARPGFAMTERLSGLPCADCGVPTIAVRAQRWACEGCGHRQERPVAAVDADPGLCPACNP